MRDLYAAEKPDPEKLSRCLHSLERRYHGGGIRGIHMVRDCDGRITRYRHPADQLDRQHLAIREDRVRMEVIHAAHFRTSIFWATFRISRSLLSPHSAMMRPSLRAQWAGWWWSSTLKFTPARLRARSMSVSTGPFTPRLRGTLLPSPREYAALK